MSLLTLKPLANEQENNLYDVSSSGLDLWRNQDY